MDATKFILDTRLELLDYANDYGAYAVKLSTRLASTKKRLGVQDKHAAKHHSNLEVLPSQVAQNNECAILPVRFEPINANDALNGWWTWLTLSSDSFSSHF